MRLTSRPTEALVHYRKAVELRGDNVQALLNLASLLDREGHSTEAIVHYRRFLELAPPEPAGDDAPDGAR